MFFTQEDFKKIEEYLSSRSKRDTDFRTARYPFNGDELVAIIQDGANVKTPLSNIGGGGTPIDPDMEGYIKAEDPGMPLGYMVETTVDRAFKDGNGRIISESYIMMDAFKNQRQEFYKTIQDLTRTMQSKIDKLNAKVEFLENKIDAK